MRRGRSVPGAETRDYPETETYFSFKIEKVAKSLTLMRDPFFFGATSFDVALITSYALYILYRSTSAFVFPVLVFLHDRLTLCPADTHNTSQRESGPLSIGCRWPYDNLESIKQLRKCGIHQIFNSAPPAKLVIVQLVLSNKHDTVKCSQSADYMSIACPLCSASSNHNGAYESSRQALRNAPLRLEKRSRCIHPPCSKHYAGPASVVSFRCRTLQTPTHR
ncbi:hypothetical protein F2P81_020227 [Scophthalmus maximus]|uniref:Uncharacterized protein n=1 Tax=Scophthalmus maximus TaxID=52904 RepID=A0A6A4RXE9_SCOMX|nr:hypothetical protein F2P81_020227 [Scophthalmus maximus]